VSRASLLAFCLALLVAAGGCGAKARHERAARPLRPLAARSWLVELELPGFLPTKVAVPLGAVQPSAIVIALHGAADRPEWTCGELRGIAGPAPFIVCPSGVRRSDFAANDPRYTFGSAADTERELRASLLALKQRFASYLKSDVVTLAGFELGAQHAAAVAQLEPGFFERVLLIDPPAGAWSHTQASLFAPRGGKRVLFVCHGAACRDGAELPVALTRRAGAEARVLDAGDGGPRLDAGTIGQIAGNWGWLQQVTPPIAKAANGPVVPAPAGSGR
jgi:hypothetical protein